MNEGKQGSVFAFGGVTGALVAVVALVATLIVLNVFGVLSQQKNANNYYKIANVESLQTTNEGKTSSDFIVDVKAPQ